MSFILDHVNILFVLYGDFSSNSANPLVLYARELHLLGHSCAVAVPSKLETISQHENPTFRPILYDDILAVPESVFNNGRPANVIHACTPREVVRRFVTSYMAKQPTPLLIYLEDNEEWISTRALGLDEASLARLTEREISDKLSDSLAHPFRYESFIGLADSVAVIQDKLKVQVPPWVHCETVMPGVDLELFSPRAPDLSLRKQYGVAESEKVIVYHGGLNGFTLPAIETLCKAVGLMNKQGYPCRLLRSGPFALDFLEQLPPEISSVVSDLGVLPRHELPDLLALADVFVQPGKIDPFEDLRLPGKLPEFLAMGRPVVMPHVNIAHLFKDGLDAVLLRTGSAEEIAEKCIGLFSNSERANAMGRAGRLFAEKYFDIRSQAPLLENAYKIACTNFNSEISSKVWQGMDENTSVTLRLVQKLTLFSKSYGDNDDIGEGEVLREHARYIESMQKRVDGLEVTVLERDSQIAGFKRTVLERNNQIANLKQSVLEHEDVIRQVLSSSSWRITRPLRAVKSFFTNTRMDPYQHYLSRGTTEDPQLRNMKRLIHICYGVLMALRKSGGIKPTINKVLSVYREGGWDGLKRRLSFLYGGKTNFNRNDYTQWVQRYDTLRDEAREAMRKHINVFSGQPLISVVMPTYNSKPEWLIDAIESLRKQIYPHWELCIADDASSDKTTRSILERYKKEDPRIKVVYREKNGHISAASNSALDLVTGEWVALLDHDDLLSEHALFWVVKEINEHPDAKLIYSDEDKIDLNGLRFDPYFKCDWNLDLFYSHNLITHLGVYRTDLVREINGFREGFEGAQDYDLALRSIERIEAEQIYHIPRVLYHWRMHSNSTAQSGDAKPYAVLAGEKALNEHFQRQAIKATAEHIGHGYRVRYDLPHSLPLVSLVILTKNRLELIQQCLESILQKTTYPNYEIIVVDNGSDDLETLQYLESLKSESRIRVVRDDRLFNFSALNNAATKLARGELLGLINNDIEVISPDWLSEMVSHALRPYVGAVGARLWYPDRTLQHGGVVLGVGGVAGHAHKHLNEYQYGYFSRASLVQSFSAVTAACLVVRKDIFEEIGGFNETDLQIAFNDIDFCLRIIEAGYCNVWTPFAELYHHESATRGVEDSPEKQVRFAKEVKYMKQHWGDLLFNDPAYSPNLTLEYEDFSFAWPPRVDSLVPSSLIDEATTLDRRDKALIIIDRKGLGLEIGPSHNPLTPKKDGYNVHILDHASADNLREKYKGHDVKLENIEEVDFIWGGEPLCELVGNEQCYDWIIASHLIEHIPDLISFLVECERLLKPNGVLSLIIPDKRYCFDYFNPPTLTGEFLDAFEQKRKRPSPGKVFDYFAGAAKCDGKIAWGREVKGNIELIHDLSEAQAHWQRARTTEEYIDVHNWRFTPSSFRVLLGDLQALDLVHLGIKAEFETVGCEFFVTLSKSGSPQEMNRLQALESVIDETTGVQQRQAI